MRLAKVEKWVVYEVLTGPMTGTKSMCTTSDWTAQQARDPSKGRMIKEDIVLENDAEKLARGTSGDAVARRVAPRPKFV